MHALARCSMVLCVGVSLLPGQTKLDLSTQARNVDFSNTASTRPIRVGTVLAPTCQVGEAFFKSNAPAGQNVYFCVAANTWMLQSSGTGGSGTSLPGTSGQNNVFLSGNATDQLSWKRYTAGSSGLLTVTDSANQMEWDVSSLMPVRDGANVWNGMNSWTPTAVQSLSAATPILCNGNQVQIGAASSLVLTATPTIADGVAGSVCTITNAGSFPVTLRDESVLAGSNLRLSSPTVAIAAGQSVQVTFNPTLGQWTMVGGSGGTGGFAIQFWSSGDSSPGDGETLYMGCRGATLNSSAGAHPCYLPKSATLKAVYMGAYQFVIGSGETSAVSIRKNNSSDTPLCTAFVNNTLRTTCNATGLNTAFSAGDFFEIKWVAPTWASNPAALSLQGIAWFEY